MLFLGSLFILSSGAVPACSVFRPARVARASNPAAFTLPTSRPKQPVNPTRQGDFGRKRTARFGAWQWDFAAHRDFSPQ